MLVQSGTGLSRPGVGMSTAGTSATDEIQGAARGGVVTFAGSSISSVMGFVLTLVLARQLGAAGSGVVVQVMAAFMIGLSVSRLGMDTTAVWIVPRLRHESPALVRQSSLALLAWAAVGGCLVAAAWWLAVGLVGEDIIGDVQVGHAISMTVWALPLGSMLLVGLATTRGFGGVLPFNLIGSIGLPMSRPIVVAVITGLGGGALAAAVGWASAVVPALAVVLVVLVRQVRGFERRQGVLGPSLPTWETHRRLLRFGLPRTMASLLEQSIIWFDVVLVGLLAGAAAAGVYGAASRFVSAGVIVLTALRIVVAPRFSSRLAAGDFEEVQQLYSVTATWIVLFGTPIYVLLACFSPTVLAFLGPDFESGTTAMVVLCLGGLALLAGGNIQSLLLMSGHSGWGALNKLMVFTVNVIGNLMFVPSHGIEAAAITWAACMCLDTTLAAIQVRRLTGIRPAIGRISWMLLIGAVCAGVPAFAAIAILGNAAPALVVATVATVAMIACYCALDRRALHLDALTAMVRRGRP